MDLVLQPERNSKIANLTAAMRFFDEAYESLSGKNGRGAGSAFRLARTMRCLVGSDGLNPAIAVLFV